MDIAVAPVTASSATRDSRVVEKVAGIGVLSIVGRKSADRLWQRSSQSAAPLSAGWCSIKSALCIHPRADRRTVGFLRSYAAWVRGDYDHLT